MRSLFKGKFVSGEIFRINTFIAGDPEKKDALRGRKLMIRERNSTILASLVGLTFAVYNGKKPIVFKITTKMVGHRFGEFSFTKAMGYDIHRVNKITRKRAKKLLATRMAKKRKKTKNNKFKKKSSGKKKK